MIWYPYVQMKKMKTPYKIVDAEGVYLYTQDNKMIDSVSSWWCMIHGYKNKEINENEIHTDQTDLDKNTENPAPSEPGIKLGALNNEKEQVARAKKRKKIINFLRISK